MNKRLGVLILSLNFYKFNSSTGNLSWQRVSLDNVTLLPIQDRRATWNYNLSWSTTLKGCFKDCLAGPFCNSLVWCNIDGGCLMGTTLLTKPTSLIIASVTLQPTWKYNKTNYYLLTKRCYLGWDCRVMCADRGLENPAIHSELENAAIIRKMHSLNVSICPGKVVVHIGMMPIWKNGKFISVWSNNSTIDYVNWDTKQPIFEENYPTGDQYLQDCTVMLTSGKWDDVACNVDPYAPGNRGPCLCMKRC
ncbi:unnamed protein product, partial [Mesorhabditis spiculigera]